MTYTVTGTLEKKSVSWVETQVKKSHVPEKSIKYYPFGLQTANSWTIGNQTGNQFLYNAGTELNNTTHVYDLFYRNYDPVLGRMNQVDRMASKYSCISPYVYALNDPVYWNDPWGDDAIKSWSDFWRVVTRLWNETPAVDPGGGGSSMGTWSSSGGYNYYASGSDGQWYQIGGDGSNSGFDFFGASSRFLGSAGILAGSTELGLGKWVAERPDRLLNGSAKLHPRFMDLNDKAFIYANRFLSGSSTIKLLQVAKVAGVTATVAGIAVSGSKVISGNGNGWDWADIGVNAVGLGATALTTLGIISNPVGWVIGGGVLLYNGYRLYQDLSKD